MIRPRNDVTVVVLTKNESANLSKLLSSLCWAHQVVIVDSYSDDNTQAIANSFANVTFVQHAFLSHAQQWNYAISLPRIQSEWVLCLDADYEVPAEFVAELGEIVIDEEVNALSSQFEYRIDGETLTGNAYGRKVVMFRRGSTEFVQQGHTQVAVVNGAEKRLKSRLIHDDRKTMSSWLLSQQRYAQLEAQHLQMSSGSRRLIGHIRRWPRLSVLCVILYLGFVKGMLFKGRAGLVYLLQRIIAESLIAVQVVNQHDTPRTQGELSARRTQRAGGL